MNGQTVILGFLFLILPVLVGVFIYLKSRKKLDEPVEEPSIRLLDGSAILNPEEKQGDIEGYTIEYSTGTEYTDEELTEFVNVRVKWKNLGGFSRVQRIKLTLMNGETVIEPPKVFDKSLSDDSDYFTDDPDISLEHTFQGRNVTGGTFIGTIKPKFEYTMTVGSSVYKPLLLDNDINITVPKDSVTLSLGDGISEELTYTPIISTKADKIVEVSESFDSDGYIFTNGQRTLNKQFGDKKLYIITAGTADKNVVHLRTDNQWVAKESNGDLKLVDSASRAHKFKIYNDPSIVSDYYYVIFKSADNENEILLFQESGSVVNGNALGEYILKTPGQYIDSDKYDSMVLTYRQRYVKNSGDEVIIKFVDDSKDYFLLNSGKGLTTKAIDGKYTIAKAPNMQYISPSRAGNSADLDAKAQKSHTSDEAGWFILRDSNDKSIEYKKSSTSYIYYRLSRASDHEEPYVMPIVRWGGTTNQYFFRQNDGFADFAFQFSQSDFKRYQYGSPGAAYSPFSQWEDLYYIRFQFFALTDTEFKHPLELKF